MDLDSLNFEALDKDLDEVDLDYLKIWKDEVIIRFYFSEEHKQIQMESFKLFVSDDGYFISNNAWIDRDTPGAILILSKALERAWNFINQNNLKDTRTSLRA